jgi:hypothetical protein
MDDRELEVRLRTHLHRRFDAAQPSPELMASIQQAVTTPPRRFVLPGIRGGTLRLGWSAVAAVIVVALIAAAGLRFGGLLGPGTVNPTPTELPPTAAPPTERSFIVLPLAFRMPSKPESDFAGTILSDRLRALDVGSFSSSSAGAGLAFVLPVDGPSDETIRAVLRATGDVEFVPLPPEDYGEGKLVAEVGEPLPKPEPALFGWDGIASVAEGTDEQSRPTLEITLKPAAREAFATYTASHLNEYLAIVIDGEVVSLPVVQAPIPGGEVSFSGGGPTGDPDDPFRQTIAILVGGMLPEFWQAAVVPAIIDARAAGRAAVASNPATEIVSADLDSIRYERGWRAVWRVVLEGEFRACIPDPLGSPACLGATTREFVLDAETGEIISSGPAN